jgi:benzoate/toluate 1,2-dioxygenase subunit beta
VIIMATAKKTVRGAKLANKPPAKKAAAKSAASKAKLKKAAAARQTARSGRATRGSVGTRGAAPAVTPAALQQEIEQFLYAQAACLDDKRWQAYIDLFTADGLYWMPPSPEYTTWDGVPSIFIEDNDLMTVRMKRVSHPNAWSQQAEWGTSHVVSNVIIEHIDPRSGDLQVCSRFHMVEVRRDDVRHFAGTYRHHLVRTGEGLRIRMQRVDMVNAQAAFEYVLQIWV